ncbi:hypothetical protein RJT34_02984 [Clitoria ternatea]|uniref:Gamma carbonic anhydrase-like 2, mitochondrial n=1 Tax=Clitoria ternatea TaxID=43366 RepID=A0AAN9KIL1_CLITE
MNLVTLNFENSLGLFRFIGLVHEYSFRYPISLCSPQTHPSLVPQRHSSISPVHSLSLSLSVSLSLMANLARFSNRALRSALALSKHHVKSQPQLLGAERAFATEAAKSITPSPDRVKWDYRGQRKIIPLGQWQPKVAVDAYVAPNVVLAGQVTVWDGASVWPGAVLRGDLNKISIGFCSNVQERCVLHAAWSSPTGLPADTSIERYVTIGAYSLLRSCTIEPECIIGQHSILMEGSLVETQSILEAGSVVPPGRRIPSGELWAGNPARFVRTLTHEETLEIPKLAVAINDLSRDYYSEFLPYSTVYLEVEKFKKSLGISV